MSLVINDSLMKYFHSIIHTCFFFTYNWDYKLTITTINSFYNFNAVQDNSGESGLCLFTAAQ